MKQSPEELQNMLYNLSTPRLSLVDYPVSKGIIVAVYSILIAMGVLENVFIVYIVFRRRHMRTVTNIFICTLAISDITLLTFNTPLQLYYQLVKNWPFGRVMCKVLFASFAIPIYTSTLTMLMIAFDRYRLILHPMKPRISKRTAVLLICMSNMIAFVIAIPLFIYTDLWEDDQNKSFKALMETQRVLCAEENWPNKDQKSIYTVVTFVTQFLAPLVIAIVLYGQIYLRLKNRKKPSERKTRTTKILAAIVILFIICWLPWSLFSTVLILRLYYSDNTSDNYDTLYDLILKAFAVSSACINPFLYGWLNENYRKELRYIIDKITGTRRSSTYEIALPTEAPSNAPSNAFGPPEEREASVSPDLETTKMSKYPSNTNVTTLTPQRSVQNKNYLDVPQNGKKATPKEQFLGPPPCNGLKVKLVGAEKGSLNHEVKIETVAIMKDNDSTGSQVCL
ncbi:prolactin-releasing peptide receptor isoform X2 [Lingula anatina]|uniref:Prolactin-releasing peptide receptor isoform X2 n=1 Tax=Lingula anatina TaxID=7574 RepID=A0A1S3HH57_LINAN|nr:prolactin-releasing peptide receptor isoform X2 [Lingula anatina]|eukprot:XP_013384821.1 prolactin-releasing peptide receptor isoform X2 [Lingula anatina]